MHRSLNYRELKHRYELDGPGATCRHLQEALSGRQLRPDDFSIRELAEALVPDGREFVRLLDPRAGGIALLEAGDAVDTSAFSNVTGQIVYTQVMDGFMREEFVASRLVDTIRTPFDGEKIPGAARIGDETETVSEGQPYPLAGFGEDWIETPKTTKRGFIVPVTKEAVFFDRTNLVLRRAAEVGEMLGINKEKRLMDCIVDVNTTVHRYKWRGTSYATYQATTPWINLKTSNALADWTDVDGAEQLLAAMVDPNTGEPILVGADTLLVCPELLHTARRVINATEVRSGDITSGAGMQTVSANTLDPYRIAASRFLRARLTAASQATSNWYLGNFRKAFAYMENWPITVAQAPGNSEAEFSHDIVARYKVSERGAAATLEPRYVVKNTA